MGNQNELSCLWWFCLLNIIYKCPFFTITIFSAILLWLYYLMISSGQFPELPAVQVKATQLCLAFCYPKDYTVHGILQARIGSLSLFQEIFPTQGSNPGLPHCRQILYQLSHKGSLCCKNYILIYTDVTVVFSSTSLTLLLKYSLAYNSLEHPHGS